MYILGISAYYHDAAACLLKDGLPVAAVQEERLSRLKQDFRFPARAIRSCLEQEGISLRDVAAVAFYEKPFTKFERLLETYLRFVPFGIKSFLTAMPVWLKEKLFLKKILNQELLREFGKPLPPLLFAEHHWSHAASAFYPSPFHGAAVLCLDGVGEWATTSAWAGEDGKLTPLWEIRFPHSLGMLYSAFTAYTGFKVNSDEYKLMGLAPYGRPVYRQKILDELVDVKADGTFRLNIAYFDYCTGLRMTNRRFHALFGGPPRSLGEEPTQREMDLAASIQAVTEEIVFRLGKTLHKETGARHLCLAGGVALNCVANGRLQREGPFDALWIQPAAGDAGGALGAAMAAWHDHLGQERQPVAGDAMQGAFLGPAYPCGRIEDYLKQRRIPYRTVPWEDLHAHVAKVIADHKVVGWFQGRMEFGPRALGARSIVGDARSASMQSLINNKIKFRESFRPFAPAVLADHAAEYFDLEGESPYMLLVAPVAAGKRVSLPDDFADLQGMELLRIPKSEIPAVTHVDFSARIQTVREGANPAFHRLISAFYEATGCPVILNTSFNVRDEPIVCTPEDAFRCFTGTGMDVLVLENFIVDKEELRDWQGVGAEAEPPEPFAWSAPPDVATGGGAPHGLSELSVRRYGTGIGVVLLFGFLLGWQVLEDSRYLAGAGAGTGLALASLAMPRLLVRGHALWMKFAALLGAVNSRIVLAVVFLLLLTPFGLVLRAVGPRGFPIRFEAGKLSYREEVAPTPQNFHRQF